VIVGKHTMSRGEKSLCIGEGTRGFEDVCVAVKPEH